MHRETSEWFDKIISCQVMIDSIERGEPSEWLLKLMNSIHKTDIRKEKIDDKNIVEFLKEFRSKLAEKLSKELKNPTIEI